MKHGREKVSRHLLVAGSRVEMAELEPLPTEGWSPPDSTLKSFNIPSIREQLCVCIPGI